MHIDTAFRAHEAIHRWRTAATSMFIGALRSDPGALSLLECAPTPDGWLVTDRAGQPLGRIVVAEGAYLASFDDLIAAPFDLESFDSAIDFFADYADALGLGLR